MKNTIRIEIAQRSFLFTTELETNKEIKLNKVAKSLALYLFQRAEISNKLRQAGCKKAKGSFIFSRSFALSIYRNECKVLDSIQFNTEQNENWKLSCTDKETFETVLNIMFNSQSFAEIFEG